MACLRLMDLKRNPLSAGQSIKLFTQRYEPESGHFGTLKLNGPNATIDFSKDQNFNDLIDRTVTYLDQR